LSAIGQDDCLSGKGLRKFAALPTATVAFRRGCGDDSGKGWFNGRRFRGDHLMNNPG